MKTAIIFGASGFVGSHLIQGLLRSPEYDRITAVTRRPLSIEHPKLETLIGGYHTLPTLRDRIIGEDLFLALGTTRKNTPDPREYCMIDHDYPVLAAKIAKANRARSVFFVSSIGANARSRFFYTRMKGETERDIVSLNFERTGIFRPSMITGGRKENRPMEKVYIGIWKLLNPLFIGPWSRYKSIGGMDIARAMSYAAQQQTEKVKIYYWKDMTGAQ